MPLKQHYFIDRCFGSWRSVLIIVQISTSYEIVGYHCGD